MDVLPAGRFWCCRCAKRSDFVVHPDASPDDPECALECWDCGYVYDKIVEEFDPKTRLPYEGGPRVRPAISREQREKARAELRAQFRSAVTREGARQENFNGLRQRVNKHG